MLTQSLAARWEPAFARPETAARLAELDDLLAATFPADREAAARRFVAGANVKLAYYEAARWSRYRRPAGWMDSEAVVSAALEALTRAAAGWSPEWISDLTGHPVRFSTYACRSIWSALERWRELELRRGLVRAPAGAVVMDSEYVSDTPARVERVRPACPLAAYGKRLTARERRVVELLYGLDGLGARRLQDVGPELGVTRERVRQIKVEAMRKLRAVAAGGLT